MDAHEAEDYIYASYARAASGLSYGGRDSSKRHPELTEEIIRGLSGTPALCVTGSKGKGSVSVMISEALRSEMSVGLMTSPHLVRFTERIRADGAEIPGTDLARCIETLKPAFDRIQAGLDGGRYISPMGIQTAAALMWFRERGTKFNVLECGKGAQYDDVNNAVHTRAVINTVFAEHTRELGADAEEIAMDKCHVITSDTRTAWTAPQTEKVLGILAERADRMNAELRIWGEDFSSEDAEVSEYGTEFSVTVGDEDLGRFRVPLLGGFQARNCALALAAAHDILPHFDRDRIASILSSVSWPGRMDLISRDPAVIMENCINRTSCSEVRSVLRDLGISEITAVIGIPDDKDFLGVAQEIAPMCRRMILTSSGNPHYRFTDMQTSVLAAAGIGSERIPGSAAALASAAADGRPVAILGTTSVISEIQALRESGMLAHIIGGID